MRKNFQALFGTGLPGSREKAGWIMKALRPWAHFLMILEWFEVEDALVFERLLDLTAWLYLITGGAFCNAGLKVSFNNEKFAFWKWEMGWDGLL